MGIYADHKTPRSAKGERGCSQGGTWFGPWQCDETYQMGREPGATRVERKYPRWVISLIKLDNGKWVADWGGCHVAGPNGEREYPTRTKALRGIIIRTARQVRRQYLVTGPQRHLVGIEGEELQTVLKWTVALLDRPEPKRRARTQRRTLFEAKQEV